MVTELAEKIQHLREVLDGTQKELASRGGAPKYPVQSLPKLNNKIWGLHKGLTVIGARSSMGKCLAKGSKVLLDNGKVEKVENLRRGDYLLGPDSKPKRISTLANGVDDLYLVRQRGGEDYVVNSEHILSLRRVNGEVVNIPVKEYLSKSKRFKRDLKRYSVGVEFMKVDVSLEPYFLGLWLGDGDNRSQRITSADKEVEEYLLNYSERLGLKLSKGRERDTDCYRYIMSGKTRGIYKRCKVDGCEKTKNIVQGYCKMHYTRFFRSKDFKRIRSNNFIKDQLSKYNLLNNKHIPDDFKLNSRKNRLELLAGLIDSDGYSNGCGTLIFCNTNKRLSEDVLFLARSLGYFAKLHPYTAKIKILNYSCLAYKVTIGGDFTDLPVRLKRKVSSNKKVRKSPSNISVKEIGQGEYYGFELDGDGLFLLEDFTVTHNSALALQMARDLAEQGHPVLFLSLEMDTQSMVERLFCQKCKIDNFDLISGEYSKQQSIRDRWEAFALELEEIPLMLTCGIGKNFAEVNHMIELLDPKPRVIIVDYIQGIRQSEKERVELNEYIRNFRQLMLENECVGILASQLNRQIIGNTDKRPELENLKSTGVLEEHCLDGDTLIYNITKNSFIKIKDIYNNQIFFPIKTIDMNTAQVKYIKPNKILKKGKLKCFEVKTKSGKKIIVSKGTRFYNGKWIEIEKLKVGDKIYVDI